MIKIPQKILRPLFLLTVIVISALLLTSGTLILHPFGSTPFAWVHAQANCASSAGTREDLCEGRDPQRAGCTSDQQLLEYESVYATNNTFIGSTSILFSPLCHTHWVRTATVTSVQQVVAISTTISFSSGQIAHNRINVVPGSQVSIESPMQFVPLKIAPTNWAGTFFLRGQRQPITALL